MSLGLCIIEGCPGNTRGKKRGEKIYFFKVLEDQIEAWGRVIPGNRKPQVNDRVCSRHFKDEDLIKEWNFVIENKTVTMPRSRWTLRVGAVPENFENYDGDLRVRLRRKSRPKSLVDVGGSSSDDCYEKPRRKRARKLKKVRSNQEIRKHAPEIAANRSKSCKQFAGKTSKENCGNSANQAGEMSWETACDNFVQQLSSICAPTPSDKLDAKPAKRRGRPRKEERRPRGRPRKDGSSSISGKRRGRPPKGKSGSISVLETSSLPKAPKKLERTKSSSVGAILDTENENCVIVEEFVASSCDDADGVEILNDSSSQITITECLIPSNLTVKTEKDDERYQPSGSIYDNHGDSCSIASSTEGSTSRSGPNVRDNAWNHEGSLVKREICDCVGDSRCCGPQLNCEQSVVELTATPVPWEKINQPLHERANKIDHGTIPVCPESKIDQNEQASKKVFPEVTIIPVSRLVHEPPKSQFPTSEVSCEIIAPEMNFKELRDLVSEPGHISDGTVISESQIEALDLTKPSSSRAPPMRDYGFGCAEHKKSKINSGVIDIEEKLMETSKNQPSISDREMDFMGFSSEEEENMILRRNHYENTAKMASQSAKCLFSKLAKACKSKAATPMSDSNVPSVHPIQVEQHQRSSAEIAMEQLNELNSMMPIRSNKPYNQKKKSQGSLVQDGRAIISSNSIEQRLVPDSKCEVVLKSGRISNEVTVTKASNLNEGLAKVPSGSSFVQGLEKVPSSPGHVLLAGKSNLEINSSTGGLISNKVSTLDDRLKNKVTTSSNQDVKDKVTPSLHQLSLKDQVKASSNRELFTNKTGSGPLKLPSNNISPITDRLPHLLYPSSLDRIIELGKCTALLDSGTSTSTCDPTVDKTSHILKNFKTDGVLALECVVLKEQVRQLQKELYLHKQMLVDSEHNAALLQRKLELQAQLPCAKCVNFKRRFIGKETLI